MRTPKDQPLEFTHPSYCTVSFSRASAAKAEMDQAFADRMHQLGMPALGAPSEPKRLTCGHERAHQEQRFCHVCGKENFDG